MSIKTLATTALLTLNPLMVAADEAASKALVTKALTETLVHGNADAVEQYFHPSYIQHNPDVPNGAEAFKGLVSAIKANGGLDAEIVRAIADDDMVALHVRYTGFGPKPMVAFDVFRVEDGKIAEHWDNLLEEQPLNPSGRSQLDGATEITDLDKAEANKAKIAEFLERSMIRHENIDITQYISPVTYVQHNPMVADGLEGFGAFMGEMAKQGISMEYSTVHQVIGEGNFVLTLSEGAFGGEPQAFYDLFRLEDGLIVEHWDIIAPMPGADAMHNEAGKF